MKIFLHIICWLLIAFCIYFPITYFHGNSDKMEVNLSHILVNTEEEALNIKKMIEEEGKSFEDMAAEYSQCPSKEEKGNLGYYEKGRLFPEIEKIAFSAKRGKISEPVQTKEGWHIVKVNNIKYYSARENFQK